MRKLIIALTFSVLELLGTIHTGNVGNEAGETSQGLHESLDTNLQSIELLAKIERDKVLPLIIFTNPPTYNYQMPEKLVKFELNEGKIAHGTEFASRDPGNQVFLCPRKNSAEKCLVPTSFQGSEPLQCSSELIPQWINLHQPCGGGDMGSGIYFQAAYKICETKSPVLYPKNISFYDMCYDTKSHKVVYTSHIIRSPGLLNLKLLTQERNVDYPVVISNDSIFSYHPITRDMFAEEAGNLIKPQYWLQQFISQSDMVFATWRKTTYNNLNYEWMNEKLISLWDEISANIRSIAKKYYSTSDKIVFIVNTAIIDINSTSEDNNQLSNIWMKMALVMKLDPHQEGLIFTHGTVILMNNFLHENESSSNRHEAIEKYCIENLCIDELTNKFTEIGGRIRCCVITPQILQHFQFDIEVKEELHILNVTVTEDQETLYFNDSLTEDQARESFREIQPNEILPLTLLLDKDDQTTLHLPTSIVKIETKDKIIVQGSEFSKPFTTKQLFFCPQEGTDETCLSNKTFNRFEPLQCAKAAVPVIRETSGTCGFNHAGIPHEVVYEICPSRETQGYEFNYSFYKFCYDVEQKRILFTQHRVVSPKLLFTNLLLRERDMQHFPVATDDSVTISPSQNEESQTDYHLQQMVPFEDMALALWRKTTHRRINANWQHKKFTPLWNKINTHIRDCVYFHELKHSRSIELLESLSLRPLRHLEELDNYIYTGVFELEHESGNPTDDQKFNMWVKRIRIDRKEVVILMNNFLVADQTTASTSLISKHNEIKKYCPESVCLDSITKDFEDIGGRIRCCPMSAKIAELFGSQEVNFEAEVLSIPDITKEM